MPIIPSKYELLYKVECASLKTTYESCVTIQPSSQPAIATVPDVVRQDTRTRISEKIRPKTIEATHLLTDSVIFHFTIRCHGSL